MFKIKQKLLCLTLLPTIPTLVNTAAASGPHANANLAALDEANIVTNKNYEPDSGDNGYPKEKTTIGGSRGDGTQNELTIYIPADFKVSSEKPVFSWEVNNATPHAVKFLLTEEQKTDPVFEKTYFPPYKAGKQKTLTPDLESGKEYSWSLFLCDIASCTQRLSEPARTSFKTY